MRRRERVAEAGCDVDGRAARNLRREPARRLHVDHALAHGAHDPPATDVGARADREACCHDHPARDVEVRDVPALEERERDDSHRLLRVVRAVGEGDPCPGRQLAESEGAVGCSGRDPDEQPEDREQQGERTREGDSRGHDRRNRHAVHEAVPLDAVEPGLGERGPDEPADQGVGRARRQTEAPRDQVPDDCPDEGGKDGLLVREAGVDDPLPDRLRHRRRHKRAGQVGNRRDENRETRRELPRRDRGRHVVRVVVEAVREIEAEGDDHDDDEQDVVHADLAVLDQDRLENVCRVLECVDCLFEPLVDVLPADDGLRVVGRGEQLRNRVADELVPLVLEFAERIELVARILEPFEPVDRLVELRGGSPDHPGLLLRLRGHALHPLHAEIVPRFFDVVTDVAERAGQPVHVVAVEGRGEGAVEEVHDLVRQAVAFVLAVLDLLHQALAVLGEALEQLYEQARDLDRVCGCLWVEGEELLLLRSKAEARHAERFYHGRRTERVRTRCYPLVGLAELAHFQVYCGDGEPRFQNDAERECAKILDYYRVPWSYEPRTFVLEQDEEGRIVEAFTPDFYLPEQDLFLEITVMKQRLVTRKNRKLRKVRERYPGIQVKLFYKRDIERLAQRFRLDLAS